MGDEKKERRVQVIDRRRFTADGELRDENEAQPPSSPAPAQPPPKAPVEPTPPSPPEVAAGTPGFLDLVDFFARQAVLLLSGGKTGRAPDREAARYLIDLLVIVQEKTGGRLSAEETRYLEDVLFQLRTLFVASNR